MEIEKLPKVENEELNEAQKTDLFNAIALGKDVTEKLETSRGTFKVKFPRLKDLEIISSLTAKRLNGIPADSYNPDSYALIQQIAYLDIVIVRGPAWYENAKKEVQGFSFGDLPSQKFLQEVYAKALEFQLSVQGMFDEEPDKRGRDGQDPVPDAKDSAGSDLYDGLSGNC